MRKCFEGETVQIAVKRRKRRIKTNIITSLAAVVVFVTVYLLILPAITVVHETYCGYEEHTHTEACYGVEKTLVCGINEGELCHGHNENCYDENGELTCTLSTEPHEHTDDCYGENGELLCSDLYKPHEHTDKCYKYRDVLTCTIPEHIHTENCWVNRDCDTNADIESIENTDAIINALNLTDDVAENMVTVAESQIGYKESVLNYTINENNEKCGTTRYSQWADDMYGEWNTTFASFCLSYSGTKWASPVTDCRALENSLGGYISAPENYLPYKGDIAFSDTDGDGRADRVGIVYDVAESKITLIEGDVEGAVRYQKRDYGEIVSYGRISEYCNDGKKTMTYDGEGYSVTVSYDGRAMIPSGTILNVTEIERDSDQYRSYISMAENEVPNKVTNEESISFARFFDISFIHKGLEIEPESDVFVSVSFEDGFSIAEDSAAYAVHFAEDGNGEVETVEKIAAATFNSASDDGEVQADTFEFSVDSLSVVGTVIYNSGTSYKNATRVDFADLDTTGYSYFIVYTSVVVNGQTKYYAFTGENDYPKTGIQLTVNGDSISWATANKNLLWTFVKNGSAYTIKNLGTGRYMHSTGSQLTTSGSWTSELVTSGSGSNETFKVKSNSDYSYLRTDGKFEKTTNASTASNYRIGYVATIPRTNLYAWLDGTCGGLMQYHGYPNTVRNLTATNGVATLTLPTVWPESATTSQKYEYTLKGWYNVKTNTYYNPGETVSLTDDAVFYADWEAATYDVGFNNEHAVDSLDTNSFITTKVFDYGALFDVQSESASVSVLSDSHTETWSVVQQGTVPYKNQNTFDFIFFDWEPQGNLHISYPQNRDKDPLTVGGVAISVNDNMGKQDNRSYITEGILDDCPNLIEQLFSTDNLFDRQTKTGILGKTYCGEGNNLYQYMDSDSSTYDGVHNGYYYYDSKLNAASYNQSEARFYIYDYLERTSDSPKDGGYGVYSDFLPFNSPYANNPSGHTIIRYSEGNTGTTWGTGPNYQYDAKDSYGDYSAADRVTTNYWVGMSSQIDFFLPNRTGSLDANNNYGNQSVSGQDMKFEFSGDDDVWVFVDGQLILDIGGLHGIKTGWINFSEGTWQTVSHENDYIANGTVDLAEGDHTLVIYYLERGGSQSNCAIYFNISPRYECSIEKRDYFTRQYLNGAVFDVFTDENCTEPAQLWSSEEEHDLHPENCTNRFTAENGKVSCWGLCAGRTYYIEEVHPPGDDYELSMGIVRISLDNRGNKSYEVTVLEGAEETEENAFTVTDFVLDPENMDISFSISNKIYGMEEVTVRAEKDWEGEYESLPQSIEIYLTANGERATENVTVTAADNWEYSWTGLRKYDDGNNLIEYKVAEVGTPFFTSYVADSVPYAESYEWRVMPALEDGETYIFTDSNRAFKSVNEGVNTVEWCYTSSAENVTDGNLTSELAQWTAHASGPGFKLVNFRDGVLTYDSTNERFYVDYSGTTPANCTQEVYYRNGKIFAYYSNDLHYISSLENGYFTASTSSPLGFTAYKYTYIEAGSGYVSHLTNVYIEESNLTRFEVDKAWASERRGDRVVMALFADGVDTGRRLELSASNNWHGVFDGLVYQTDPDDDSTIVNYTVAEEFMINYEPRYGEIIENQTEITGAEIISWNQANSIANNGTYRIMYDASHVLAANSNGTLTFAAPSDTDNRQLWKFTTSTTGYKIQNVGTNTYLNFSTTSGYSLSATGATIYYTNGSFYRTTNRRNYYILYNNGSVGYRENSGSAFTMYTKVVDHEPSEYMTYYSTTVTNTYVSRKAPATGGNGTAWLEASGLIIMLIPASVYLISEIRNSKKKGRKKKDC